MPYIPVPFVGLLNTEFQFDGTTWNSLPPGQIFLGGCGSGPNSCTHYIFLPTVWDSLQGTVYAEDGTPDTSIESMEIISLGNTVGYQFLLATVPVINGNYSVSVPVGEGSLHVYNDDLSRFYQAQSDSQSD